MKMMVQSKLIMRPNCCAHNHVWDFEGNFQKVLEDDHDSVNDLLELARIAPDTPGLIVIGYTLILIIYLKYLY